MIGKPESIRNKWQYYKLRKIQSAANHHHNNDEDDNPMAIRSNKNKNSQVGSDGSAGG